ncbi:MAG: right-handed parallel beta-helix repeat-containing protein [Lachnospiraceae bacterium]
MFYYVSQKNACPGDGTKENPFQTINQAAQIAKAGDTVIIGDGIYREWVNPVHGGTGSHQRITYKNAENTHPIISGAEIVTGWEQEKNDVWKIVIDNALFGDCNPYADEIFGDWYDPMGQVHHTGEVYLDGEAMYEEASLDALYAPSEKAERTYRWYSVVNRENTTIFAAFPDKNPNESCTEINVRPYCFFPSREGRNYITVSGLTLCRAATQWAPPTAFQPGLIGVNWSKGWIIENCTIHDSKCCGISLGKRAEDKDNIWSIDPYKGGSQTYTEIIFQNINDGWDREHIGSHIIRNNTIYNCGQTGIVGCMGGAFSTITGNHIYHCNVRKEFSGAEVAGIKLHAAIDTVVEKNCIHNCVRGLWLDWEAQGASVEKNLFYENILEDLFIEVCHGPCLVENNIMLSKRCVHNMSQGTAYIHNLFYGEFASSRETSRFTLYHLPHSTMVGGVMFIYGGDDRIINNIFIGKNDSSPLYGTASFNSYEKIGETKTVGSVFQIKDSDKTLPTDIHDNVYLNGARPWDKEHGARTAEHFQTELSLTYENSQYILSINLCEIPVDLKVSRITTEMLGRAFESEQSFENRDGSPVVIDEDCLGQSREETAIPGPFAHFADKITLPF